MPIESFPKDLYRTFRPGYLCSQDGFIYMTPADVPFTVMNRIEVQINPQLYGKKREVEGIKKHVFITKDFQVLDRWKNKLPCSEDPSSAPHTELTDYYEFKIGVIREISGCYQKALRFLETAVLQDPKGFFNGSIEEIKTVFLHTQELILAYDPSLSGKLRESPAFTTLHKKHYNLDAQIDEVPLDDLKYYPGPGELPQKLDEICRGIQTLGKSLLQLKMEPVEAAAEVHKKIVDDHLFEEGNGRDARLWMNVLLQVGGIQAIAFTDQKEYQRAVESRSLEKLIEK